MNEAQFRHALHLGLGRAILYAQNHDVTRFRDVILDACLHCYSYDGQIEGTRTDFMFELVNALPDAQFYFHRVLDSLKDCGDDWHAAQRFRFAYILAEAGHDEAKEAMYAAYAPSPRMGESIGVKFLQMDGVKGFLFVADKIGELHLSTEKVDFGWLMMAALEDLGEQATRDALRDAAILNPRLAAFQEKAQETHGPSKPHQRPILRIGPTPSFWQNLPARTPTTGGAGAKWPATNS